jgi:hypothetical protein
MAFENRKIYGSDRYLIIRYEDLVQHTRRTMETVAYFLDIKLEPINIKPTFQKVSWAGNSFTGEKYKSVSKDRTKIYHQIPKVEIKILEYYFKEFMCRLNYPLLYSSKEQVDAVREYYAWYNANQTYSNKPYRKYK